ncbi:MAG TPA: plastocyanin/azurin family copper-binding protein [Pusillimonas sp.]|uniref:plastocyanin/azurin family copper-binding protein n=1 Tax=Pusillimonas sp. TaxID=3040095 RepID=UPI002C65234A|nr:plastocyanin/azurin family copper-binding protein [Pusillimonas sp.]HUH87449.1 plastocyanin/azurin family copper-binding protein [Pusillimonas sp.]
MSLSRRRFMLTGGLVVIDSVAGLTQLRRAFADQIIEVAMGGTTGGAHVWFRPAGLLIQPGQTIRWTNHDAGNSHTATAYHPERYGKQRRIPEHAEPWDSGFLLPGESFSVTLTVPGVYDYYCLPHEHAGMVGRIIVGKDATEPPAPQQNQGGQPPPDIALRSFPPVDRILNEKTVE